MKAIIVDDERLARQELKKLLAEVGDVEVIAECSSAEDAIEEVDKVKTRCCVLRYTHAW